MGMLPDVEPVQNIVAPAPWVAVKQRLELETKVKQLIAENDRLKEENSRLRKFAKHETSCKSEYFSVGEKGLEPKRKCDCGLEATAKS